MATASDQMTDRRFVRRFLIGLALVGLALLVWRLADVILLVFGAALVAVILRAIADPVARRTALSGRLALLVAVLFVLGLMGLAGWLFGSELAAQASALRETIPETWRSFEARLGDNRICERVLSALRDAAEHGGRGVVADLGRYALSLGSALTDVVLVLVAGAFLAAPLTVVKQLYVRDALGEETHIPGEPTR